MKNLYTLIALILFTSLTAFGQGKVDYDSRSRFYLGFNFGGTYHSNTEVAVNSLYRGGAGFTFGYSFGMKPNRLLSLDLQLRYLLAAYRGQSDEKYALDSSSINILENNSKAALPLNDYKNAYGYYAPNFHTWVNDWSLELKLNTNRLRERTGWNFFALGGIGYNRYHTEVDFYDNSNLTLVKAEADLFDKDLSLIDYETSIVNKRDWMPSFGMGIEKQITPNAAFTIMGRMTWTRNNDFDGLGNTFNGVASDKNDRYHYASAGLKFYLRGHKNQYVKEEDDDVNLNNNPVVGKAPTVKFNQPNTSPYVLNATTYDILAEVHYVAGKGNITFTQNGSIITNYVYNANTDKLNYSANLQVGKNVFVINAINDFGKASAQTIIVYEMPSQLPIVQITNPAATNQVVNQSSFNFNANIQHVVGKENTTLSLNGVNLQNFSFNNVNLSSILNLVPGKNVVTVTGKNDQGVDSESTIIIYQVSQTLLPPVVNINVPSSANTTVNVNQVNVVGQALYVTSKNNVEVLINGVKTNNFAFNNNSKQVQFTATLVPGSNNITIKGSNNDGQDQASVTVYYNQVVVKNPPLVNIINPATDNKVFKTQNTTLNASVLNVAGKSNITVNVNGNNTNNYSYNANSDALSLPLSLISGNNVVTISATNADGSDSQSRVLIYKKAVTINPPTVVYSNPSSSPLNVTNSSFNLVAQTTNIVNQSQITFRQNGNLINSSNYSFSNNTLNYQGALVVGANVFDITVLNGAGSDSKSTVINYTEPNIPCTAPTVGYVAPTPNSTVNSATQLIEAQVNNYITGTSVNLTLNGVALGAMSYNNVTQIASKTVSLNVGNNTLEIDVANTCGTNKSTFVLNYQIVAPPCSTPAISIKSSTNPISTSNYSFSAQVSGSVTASQLTLTVNGQSKPFNFSNGNVSASLSLNAGSNSIVLKAVNACGNDSKTITVQSNPCTQPTLSAVSPLKLINSTTSATFTIKASASSNITLQQISVKLNNVAIPFVFNANTITVNANALNIGLNQIEIEVVNTCGKASLKYEITRTACVKPVVQINNKPGTVTSLTYQLSANITGVNSAKNIVLLINGQSTPFNYSLASKQLVASVKLKEGSNTIVLSGTNNCGTVKANLSVIAKTCTNPKLTSINPSSLKQSTQSATYTLTIGSVGVSSVKEIAVVLNGKSIPFTFQSNKITIKTPVLKMGSNNIKVVATNACGSVNLSYTITRLVCNKPSISILSSQGSVTSLTYQFSASVSQMNGKKGITLKLNGKSVPFTFDTKTNKVAATLILKVGVNNVSLLASNTCGSGTKTFNITASNCQPPTVTAAYPTNLNVTTANNVFVLTLKTTNVTNQNQIVVSNNGTAIPFTFNSSTQQVSISVSNMTPGNNNIKTTANSACGNASVTYVLNYTGTGSKTQQSGGTKTPIKRN